VRRDDPLILEDAPPPRVVVGALRGRQLGAGEVLVNLPEFGVVGAAQSLEHSVAARGEEGGQSRKPDDRHRNGAQGDDLEGSDPLVCLHLRHRSTGLRNVGHAPQ
jgi:hypothetical protein